MPCDSSGPSLWHNWSGFSDSCSLGKVALLIVASIAMLLVAAYSCRQHAVWHKPQSANRNRFLSTSCAYSDSSGPSLWHMWSSIRLVLVIAAIAAASALLTSAKDNSGCLYTLLDEPLCGQSNIFNFDRIPFTFSWLCLQDPPGVFVAVLSSTSCLC